VRVTPERELEIIEAYERWDGVGGVDAFTKSVGVTKQTFYAVLVCVSLGHRDAADRVSLGSVLGEEDRAYGAAAVLA
jgi:hypothetical protein